MADFPRIPNFHATGGHLVAKDGLDDCHREYHAKSSGPEHPVNLNSGPVLHGLEVHEAADPDNVTQR